MCLPAAVGAPALITGMKGLMVAGTAASVAGSGMQMYGQYQQGKAAESAANYNARMKELAAESVNDQTSHEVRQRNDKLQKQIALGRVSAASSGIDLSSGSVLDWEGDMQTDANTDMAVIRHNAELQKFGLRSGAALDRANAGNSMNAAYWGMGTTALSGTGRIAGDWADFKLAGG